jgi:hypothetical protein
MSERDEREPTSSSAVNSNSTPDRSASDATPWMACTMPAFMSKTPGPVTRPSATVNGRSASEPNGNTVSWCPTISTRGAPSPRQWTCGPAGPSTICGREPSRSSITSANAAADAVSAATSFDGDSMFTRVARSSSIASRSITALFLPHPSMRAACGCDRTASS